MWIVLKNFSSRMEAEMAKSVLESAGIQVQISADDQGGMRLQLSVTGGVKLLVMKEQEQEAKQALS